MLLMVGLRVKGGWQGSFAADGGAQGEGGHGAEGAGATTSSSGLPAGRTSYQPQDHLPAPTALIRSNLQYWPDMGDLGVMLVKAVPQLLKGGKQSTCLTRLVHQQLHIYVITVFQGA